MNREPRTIPTVGYQSLILGALVAVVWLSGCVSNPGPVDDSLVRRDQYGTYVIDQPGVSDAELRREVLGKPSK